MPCLLCKSLKATWESRRNEYIQACSSAIDHVSKRLTAYLNVEMERAWSELEEHRLFCLSAANENASPSSAMVGDRSENAELHRSAVGSAA